MTATTTNAQASDIYQTLDSNVQCYTGTASEVTIQCNGKCCVGNEACSHWSGDGINTVCEASCIGDRSCKHLSGRGRLVIRTQSCVGVGACRDLEVGSPGSNNHVISAGSCRGRWACYDTRAANLLHIGIGSCIGEGSCSSMFHATSGIGDTISIGDRSCIGDNACEYYTARHDLSHSILVDNNECVGEDSCSNCDDALFPRDNLYHLASSVCG